MKTVLVIEDDEVISAMYKVDLLYEGYKTILASSGLEGIAAVEKERPSLILLDIRMPVMDGVETLRRIRKLPNGKDVPVLVITNIGKDERLEDFEGLNIAGYIVKADVTPPQLDEIIKETLKHTEATESAGFT
jgi:CheY-like chemotaxis protein